MKLRAVALSAITTYTGHTRSARIAPGLSVSNSSGSGTGAGDVQVFNGATFSGQGNGGIGGKLILKPGSTVSPGPFSGDGITALAAIEQLSPELVLLDVQMPELDGLGVAAAIGENGPAIVFATAHDTHALRAFELAAVDYVLKPISKERLRAALDRVKKERAPAAELARAVLEHLGAGRARADAPAGAELEPAASRGHADRAGTRARVHADAA